ncbi:hypothetical protein QE152_g4885 [Popillia japonica]|uniref:Uncharacterized protein n=1 Tax=Popillia japonica TaxID=7064 RepID=A0AAW1MZ69_POPJA
MENSFTQQKFGYQDHTHKKSKSQLHETTFQRKDLKTVHKGTPHKSVWQYINIFSKIRKTSKSKIKETESQVTEANGITQKELKPCQSKGMDEEHSGEDNSNNDREDESTSIASKTSFLGKMNLENLLKIFIDLHKKKQSSQNRQKTNETAREEQSAELDFILKGDESQIDFSRSQIVLESNVSSNPLILPDCNESPLFFTEIVQNPVNSPSLINTNIDKNILNITAKEDTVSNVDSTLSLLNNVSIKLENYLSEVKNNILAADTCATETGSSENSDLKQEESLPVILAAESDIKTETGSSENSDLKQEESLPVILAAESDIKTEQKAQLIALHQEKNSSAEVIEYPTTENDEAEDKKLAYTIVESDIKRMIKELLQESNNLKNSIVATGIQEEPASSFSEISKSLDSFIICRGICNDLLNAVFNKHISTLKTRHNLIVNFKRDAEKEADYVLTKLLENVITQKSVPKQQVQVNYCLIQTNSKSNRRKQESDPSTRKFRESIVYILTKQLYKMKVPSKKEIHPPKVTVHNLSMSKRIRFASSENSLICRIRRSAALLMALIRRSAALLMALYDEMRDYSYYNCTSNILCDLYESMIKQGLISLTNLRQHKSIENIVLQRNIQSEVISENSDHQFPTTSTLPLQSSTDSNTDPRSSCSNPSNMPDIRTSPSSDSSSSESDDEHAPRRTILPNLKYTYQSDLEINTPEEVKIIDENAAQNGACRDVNIKEFLISEESISIDYEIVSINENEAFIKEL